MLFCTLMGGEILFGTLLCCVCDAPGFPMLFFGTDNKRIYHRAAGQYNDAQGRPQRLAADIMCRSVFGSRAEPDFAQGRLSERHITVTIKGGKK